MPKTTELVIAELEFEWEDTGYRAGCLLNLQMLLII
jgi:hypothetical protein